MTAGYRQYYPVASGTPLDRDFDPRTRRRNSPSLSADSTASMRMASGYGDKDVEFDYPGEEVDDLICSCGLYIEDCDCDDRVIGEIAESIYAKKLSIAPVTVTEDVLLEIYVRSKVSESVSFRDQLLLEGYTDAAISNAFQWIVAGITEYGLALTGFGAPAAPFAETLVDALFSMNSISATIAGTMNVMNSVGEIKSAINDAIASYGSDWSSYYKSIVNATKKIGEVGGKSITGSAKKLQEKVKTSLKNVIKKSSKALGDVLQLVIPDATIGAAAAVAIEGTLTNAADNIYDLITGGLDKIKFLSDFVKDPAKGVAFFEKGYNLLIQSIKQLKEKLDGGGSEGGSLLSKLTSKLPQIPGTSIIRNKLMDAIISKLEAFKPKFLKLIENVLKVFLPTFITIAGIYQAIASGDVDEEFEEEEKEEEKA
jgi:hypothetical protein